MYLYFLFILFFRHYEGCANVTINCFMASSQQEVADIYWNSRWWYERYYIAINAGVARSSVMFWVSIIKGAWKEQLDGLDMQGKDCCVWSLSLTHLLCVFIINQL